MSDQLMDDIVKTIKTDEDWFFHMNKRLWDIEDQRVIDCLIAEVKEGKSHKRINMALHGLGENATKPAIAFLTEYVRNKANLHRPQAVISIGYRTTDENVLVVLREYIEDRTNPERECAVYALDNLSGRIPIVDDELISKILDFIIDEDPYWSYAFPSLLRNIKAVKGNKKVFERLAQRYDVERNTEYVGEAILDLTMIELESELLSRLVSPPMLDGMDWSSGRINNSIQFYFIKALAKIKSKKAIEPLIQLTKHYASHLQKESFKELIAREAVRALGNIGDVSAAQAIMDYLAQTTGSSLYEVVADLAKLAYKPSFDFLLTQRNKVASKEYYEALITIDRPRVYIVIIEDISKGSYEAIPFLKYFEETEGIEVLMLDFIRNPNNCGKIHAIVKLGELGKEESRALVNSLLSITEASFNQDEWYYPDYDFWDDKGFPPPYYQFQGALLRVLESVKKRIGDS